MNRSAGKHCEEFIDFPVEQDSYASATEAAPEGQRLVEARRASSA